MAQEFIGWPLAEAIKRTTGSQRSKSGADKFWALVRDGQLRVFGRQSSGRQLEFIPPSDCDDLLYRDYDASILSGAETTTATYRDVVVYPVVHSPDALDVLDGMPLRDAFARFVLGDPELRVAYARAKQSDGKYHSIESLTQHASIARGEWPHDLRREDLVHDAKDKKSWAYLLHGTTSREVASAQSVLYERLATLFGFLIDGRLEGVGDPVRSHDQVSILSTIWSHRSYYFEARNGDVLEVNDDAENPSIDYLRTRWRAVKLLRPQVGVLGSLAQSQTRPRGDWIVVKNLTTSEEAVFVGLKVLYPAGLSGVQSKERNSRIIEYLASHPTLRPCSPTTINRCMSKVEFRR